MRRDATIALATSLTLASRWPAGGSESGRRRRDSVGELSVRNEENTDDQQLVLFVLVHLALFQLLLPDKQRSQPEQIEHNDRALMIASQWLSRSQKARRAVLAL